MKTINFLVVFLVEFEKELAKMQAIIAEREKNERINVGRMRANIALDLAERAKALNMTLNDYRKLLERLSRENVEKSL